jgi:hypothetical protein
VDSDEINQLLIRCCAFVRYWRKNGNIMGQYISYLQIFKKACESQERSKCTVFPLNFVYLLN